MEILTIYNYSNIESRIHIPSFQRDINTNIVKNIKDHILKFKSLNKSPILSVLDFALYQGIYYIIDGNHRLNAIKELCEENIIIPFYVYVYEVESFEEMKEIFIIRNSGIDVPNYIINPPFDKKELINTIKQYLTKIKNKNGDYIFKYPSSKSTRVNRPYVNIDIFLTNLINCEFFIKIYNIESFISCFNSININIKKKLDNSKSSFIKNNTISNSMIINVNDIFSPIYIGILKSYDFLDELL